MSSLETSSPVSASTFMYLMRWPVFLLIWLKLIFSESEVAGYKATGQVTSERRKKPFQLARGPIQNTPNATEPGFKTISARWFRHRGCSFGGTPNPSGLLVCSSYVLICGRGLPWNLRLYVLRSSTCAARYCGSEERFVTFNERGFRQPTQKSCLAGCSPRWTSSIPSVTGN